MAPSITKIVIPVAGMGTRFLPATKAMPKELLPIVDRPLIQYAIDEARAAGISEFVFVTGPREDALKAYLTRSGELMDQLAAAGKSDEIEKLNQLLPAEGCCRFVRQQDPKGPGHAVLMARELVGSEPFAVLFPDDLIRAEPPTLQSMINAFDQVGGNVVAVEEVPPALVSRYGVIDPGQEKGELIEIKGMVEKPATEDAPSNKCIIGRYILLPEIFDHLATLGAGAGGEIQLTDAIAAMIASTDTHAFPVTGTRYDCGSKAGFLAATIDFALARKDIASDVKEFLQHVNKD